MGLRDLPYKPDVLGNDYLDWKVSPSDTYYYDQYAYKVVFDDSEFANWRQRVHFKRQLEDFSWDLKIYEIRSHIASNGMRLYVRHKKDLDIVLGVFSSQIVELHGPIDDEHLAVLTTADQYLMKRKSLLYKQYDCKFYLPGIRRLNPKTGMLGYASWNYDRSELKEHEDFWAENLSDTKVIYNQYGWKDSYVQRTFYTTYQDYRNILPYFKIAYPEGRTILHKVMLI